MSCQLPWNGHGYIYKSKQIMYNKNNSNNNDFSLNYSLTVDFFTKD